MSMRLKLLGVRGSRPTHKRHLLGYGGNSTAFEFICDGAPFYLFVDGGSGLARRGQELGTAPEHQHSHILVTHTHWDHILGYPFFQPLYSADHHLHFYAPRTQKSDFQELFVGLRRAVNLPIPSSAMKAQLHFTTLQPGDSFSVDWRVRVQTFQLNHQGVTLGYKLTSGSHSCCIITDHAPMSPTNVLGEGMQERAISHGPGFAQMFNDELVAFLRGTHTVVFDTHFTEATLKPDWGHSTPERALALCAAANVKRLLLFHHAPEDHDVHVDHKVRSVFQAACLADVQVEAAREGDLWDL